MPLTGLTPEQFAAATAPPAPIIIVAGPGSGKTRTIVARARYYSQVIDPRRILLVTFTNKAAREAEERLSRLGASGFHVSTFHSLCAQNLLARTKFSIADEDAAKSIIKEAIEIGSLGLDPGRMRDWISCERNKGYTLSDLPPMATTEFVEVWKKYDELKRHYRLYDFDDLLSEFNNTGIVDEVAQFFQMVLVDEVQDSCAEQMDIMCRLAVPHRNVTAVGDADQSIYSWRGAQPVNLEKFRDKFEAQVFELTRNHRSTGSIVEFGRKIITQYPAPMRTSTLSSTRHQGFDPSVYVFYDNEAEAKAISTWVSSLLDQGVPPQEIAVLFRTNAQTQPVEEAFTEASIRYTVVGAMSFYDRKEVRDALSFLRVQVNDRDIPSLRRSLLCVPGVGDGSVRDIVSIMNESGCGPLVAISEYCQSNKSSRADMLQQYADCMHQMQELKPEEGIKLIADEFLAPKYAEDKRSQDRLENVNALCNVAARFSSVGQLVVSASLVSSSDEQHRGVCLATCHAVKGLEFSSVWVAGVEDDLFPHSKADSEEEENRLLYVACTRAKDLLAVSWCRMRRSWGKIKQSQPSRFLEAIGASDE